MRGAKVQAQTAAKHRRRLGRASPPERSRQKLGRALPPDWPRWRLGRALSRDWPRQRFPPGKQVACFTAGFFLLPAVASGFTTVFFGFATVFFWWFVVSMFIMLCYLCISR